MVYTGFANLSWYTNLNVGVEDGDERGEDYGAAVIGFFNGSFSVLGGYVRVWLKRLPGIGGFNR